VSSASEYRPVPCPNLPPEACEALNAWGQAWKTWGQASQAWEREVMTFLQKTSEWMGDNRGATGVPPPPPPPPPREPPPEAPFIGRGPGPGPGPIR
jgi:hypothetical protein